MGFFAKQGKHDPNADRPKAIVSTRELARIMKLESHKFFDNQVDITFKVVSEGEHQNKTFHDGVPYLASDPFAWKYIALRKAAGVPYKEDEPVEIDLEELLLGKIVPVALTSVPKKDDPSIQYQRVKYLKLTEKDIEQLNQTSATGFPGENEEQPQVTAPKSNESTPAIDVNEDDLPF